MSEPQDLSLDLEKAFLPSWAQQPTDPNRYARFEGGEGERRGRGDFGDRGGSRVRARISAAQAAPAREVPGPVARAVSAIAARVRPALLPARRARRLPAPVDPEAKAVPARPIWRGTRTPAARVTAVVSADAAVIVTIARVSRTVVPSR